MTTSLGSGRSRHLQRVAAVCVVLFLAAGCGGEAHHFTLMSTRACLEARRLTTQLEDNWLFKPTEGALVVIFGRQYVSLNFGEDETEAQSIRDAARSAGGARWPVGSRANVAYVWSAQAKSRVSDVLTCLRE